MKIEKVSFFKRLYLAIADFRLYPFAKSEKLTVAIGYFLKLIILMSIIIGACFTTNVFEELPAAISIADRTLPEFTLNNGVLDSAENITRKINDDWHLIVNDEVNYKELNTLTFDEDEEFDFYAIVLSDATTIAFRTADGIVELGGILYESNMNFTKAEMIATLGQFYESPSSKLVFWGITSLGVIVILLIARLWTLIMYIMSIFIINIMFGVRLKWQDYFKISIYVSTLPVILETLAIITVGNISESINFIIVLISCVYIFYALRALKLDSFINYGTGKNAEEKIKNALVHAQKELERQLAELEKEELKNKEIKDKEEKNPENDREEEK